MTENQHQFFVILPSNSSMNIYPSNTISNFKVQLPSSLNLNQEKWEVALSEIQFPHLWYNVRDGKNTIVKEYVDLTTEELDMFFPIKDKKDDFGEDEAIDMLTYYKRKELQKQEASYKQHITIPIGYYNTVDDIINEVIKLDSTLTRNIQASYNKLANKVEISLPSKTKLHFEKSDVASCLGFHANSTIEGHVLSETVTNLGVYSSIYVYSDIIQNQHVGDVKVPLLRVVPVTSKYGEHTCIHYDRPHFMPIARNNIQTIEVNLRDHTGEFISFESGRAVVTLVFRRKAAKFYA